MPHQGFQRFDFYNDAESAATKILMYVSISLQLFNSKKEPSLENVWTEDSFLHLKVPCNLL